MDRNFFTLHVRSSERKPIYYVSMYTLYTASNSAIDRKILFMNSVIDGESNGWSVRWERQKTANFHQTPNLGMKSFNLHSRKE